MVYPALLPLLPLMCTPRLPVVDWTDDPADLNGLVRFMERQNLVSAHVPSRFKRAILHTLFGNKLKANQIFPLYIFTPARFIVRFEFSLYCASLIANLFSDWYLCRVVRDIYARILKRGIIITLSHEKGNFPHSMIFLGYIRDFTIRLKPNSPTQSLLVDLFMIKSITYSTASLLRLG